MKNSFNFAGTLENIEVSHKIRFDQPVYKAFVSIQKDGHSDKIPVWFQENVKQVYQLKEGAHVNLYGELRTRNYKSDDRKPKLLIGGYVFQANQLNNNFNQVILEGTICKKNRIMNKNNHNVCSVILAVNRTNGKRSDYIPCVGHHINANLFRDLPINTKVKITGQFVSRQYIDYKDEKARKVTYEVLAEDIKVID